MKHLVVAICLVQLSVTTAAVASGLEAKLSAQWERYQVVRKILARRISNEQLPLSERVLTRQEWEKALELPKGLRFSTDDLVTLRRTQAERVAQAQRKAQIESAIDFEQFRSDPAWVGEFCRTVPKGGMLHIHPGGTMTKETAERLLRADDPELPLAEFYEAFRDPSGPAWLYPEELEWLNGLAPNPSYVSLSPQDQRRYLDFFVLPPGSHPFSRFASAFYFVRTAINQSYENLASAYHDFVERAARSGVFYVEFTTGMRAENVWWFEELAEKLETKHGLVARFNRSFSRSPDIPLEDRFAATEDLLKVDSDLVVGIDMVAEETRAPALEQGQIYYGLVLDAVLKGQSDLHRTQHSGEHGDPRNPRDAIIMGAERLGHAVKLVEDPVALEYAARHQIGVETNLISNLKLQAVESLQDHPYLFYLRLGIPVSLSTDDEGIFETDISRECELAVTRTDLTYDEFKTMAFNSIRAAFASELEKARLMQRLKQAFVEFESSELFLKAVEASERVELAQ